MTDLRALSLPAFRPSVLELAEHASVAVAIGTLAVVLAADGGRDTAKMVPVLLACLPALAFTMPWARLSGRVLALFASVPTAAIAVCYLTPTGFAYSRDLCVWAYGAVLGVVALSYVRTEARRLAVVLFVCLLGFYDVARGFVPWRFHGDPARAMVGTFYQQDMFGAFCVAIALTAAALAVFGPSPWRWVGWVVAPLCACGTVLSTSRAGEGLLALGVLTLGVIAASGPDRARRLVAWLALIAISVGLLYVLTGPLFFPSHSGSPLSGTTRRSGRDSLGSSSSIRQAYWKAALHEFADAPIAGEGFGAFGLTFFDRAPLGAFGSRYAHNGFLQGLGEGGILFGLPLLLTGLAAVVTATRGLGQPIKQRGLTAALPCAAALGALALLGHTLVDFDWTFPALMGVLVVLACSACQLRSATLPARFPAIAALVLLAAATCFSAYAVNANVDTTKRIARAQQAMADGRADLAATTLLAADRRWLPNPLVWSTLLGLSQDRRGPLSTSMMETALRETRAMADLDPDLQMSRATVLLKLGRTEEGLTVARRAVQQSQSGRPDLIADYAQLLADAGQRTAATGMLISAVHERAVTDFPLPDNVWRLVAALQSVAGLNSPDARCAFRAAESAFGSESRPTIIPEPAAAGPDCSP